MKVRKEVVEKAAAGVCQGQGLTRAGSYKGRVLQGQGLSRAGSYKSRVFQEQGLTRAGSYKSRVFQEQPSQPRCQSSRPAGYPIAAVTEGSRSQHM